MTERGARLDGERRILQVTDVLRAIEDQFHTAFPRRIWVYGSIRGLHAEVSAHQPAGSEAGGTMDAFVLVEESESGLRTLPCELAEEARQTIDDSLRRLHDVAVEDLLVDGYFIRAGGLLNYDPERHCAIFSVTALDPQPTAMWLAERREEVRTAAAAARLAERQRDLRVPVAPVSIALVAAAGDPSLQRARQLLDDCDFAIEVRVYAPTVGGSSAGDQLANGLREAALGGHDIVLLLRQDGRPLSLAPFDTEAVVRAVATSTTPVLTGLGSPEEPAAAEEVAHQAYPTSDEATISVVRRLQRASDQVEDTVEALADAGDRALRRAALRLEQARHGLAEDIRQATVRANKARAARLLRIRLFAAALAVIVIVAAALTQVWPILAALVVPIGIAVAAPRLRTQRRGPVAVTQYTFTEALNELSTIGRRLQESSDPDEVLRLEADADALAEHCRALLRRPRKLRSTEEPSLSASAAAGSSWPAVTADGGVITGPVEPAQETDVFPATESTDAVEILPPAGEAANGPTAVDNPFDSGEPTQTLVLPSDAVASERR